MLYYKQFFKCLAAIGIKEEPRPLANKINRGQFSTVFLLQCLKALGLKGVELNWEAMQDKDKGKPAMAVATWQKTNLAAIARLKTAVGFPDVGVARSPQCRLPNPPLP